MHQNKKGSYAESVSKATVYHFPWGCVTKAVHFCFLLFPFDTLFYIMKPMVLCSFAGHFAKYKFWQKKKKKRTSSCFVFLFQPLSTDLSSHIYPMCLFLICENQVLLIELATFLKMVTKCIQCHLQLISGLARRHSSWLHDCKRIFLARNDPVHSIWVS